MNTQLDKETALQLSQCVDLLKEVLGTDLLGVYLYGSAIVGGLQKFSDLDLFVVSKRPTTLEEKESLEKRLLTISGIYGVEGDRRPTELIIVVQSDIAPWKYPPKFDFLYGEWLRKKFEEGIVEPWSKEKISPDLAILITQIHLASQTLYGPPPHELLDPVPYRDVARAILAGIDTIMPGFDDDIRNGLLTLARMWYTVANDIITSKPTTCLWAIEKVPELHKPVLKRAYTICMGGEKEYWDDLKNLFHPCAEFMISKIKERISILEASNFGNKTIKLVTK